MADNYIERQQEQYEARKAAWKQAQKYGKKKTGTTHQVRTGQADKIPVSYTHLTLPTNSLV